MAIILALTKTDLLSMILFTNIFYGPTVSVIFIMAVLGFRTSTKSALIVILAGLLTVIIWKIIGFEADPIFCAMIVNAIFLIGSHYLLKQKGGWVGIKDKKSYEKIVNQGQMERLKRPEEYKKFSFIAYCRKKFPTNAVSYSGIGIYFIIFTITTMYCTHSVLLSDKRNIVLGMYQVMMVTGVILAMYPIWPATIRQELKETIIQVACPIVIFFMLIIFNFFFLFISNFGLLQFSVFTLNLVISSIVVGWRLASIMTICGILIVNGVFSNLFNEYHVNFSIGSPGFICTYLLMLVATTLVIFIKPKQEYQELAEEKTNI